MDATLSPTLRSDRLLLRPIVLEDFEALHALTLPPEMRTYLGPSPPTIDASFQRFLRHAGCWAVFGFGMFAVIDRERDAFIGTNGLFMGRRGLGDDFDPNPEAGWIIAVSHWGRGIACEAAQMAHRWIDRQFAPPRTVCMIEEGNAASVRVAAKLGYHDIGVRSYNDTPMLCFARTR